MYNCPDIRILIIAFQNMKTKVITFYLFFLLPTSHIFAQSYSAIVHQSNGVCHAFHVDDIDSMTFERTENVPTEYFTPPTHKHLQIWDIVHTYAQANI